MTNARQKKPIVLVGRGRLGQKIQTRLLNSKKLSTSRLSVEFAKISPSNGLMFESRQSGLVSIDTLIICISPGITKKWQWQNIFDGVEKQVKQGLISIERALFISSTRVYDGIENGVVDASVAPIGASDRANYIILAEQKLLSLCQYVHILRCSGLIGEGYQRYEALLKSELQNSVDKNLNKSKTDTSPRFAVNIETIANKVAAFTFIKSKSDGVSVITDEHIYYAGEKLSFEQGQYLCARHRLLKNSDFWKDS